MSHNHDHNHTHDHSRSSSSLLRYAPEAASLVLMLSGMFLRHRGLLGGCWQILFFILAVLPVARTILVETWQAWRHGDFMNEFTLMLLACVGAFAIGEYPEGVAILLFYSFGEKLEDSASQRARSRISSLLANIPDTVTVVSPDGAETHKKPGEVVPGDMIRLLPGQRLAVDSALVSPDRAEFNNAAITGESMPVDVAAGQELPSGAVALDRAVTLRAVRKYEHSTMTRIMAMIQDAASQKSHSETLLRRITRYYTPAVMIAALLMFVVPWGVCTLQGVEFNWQSWLYRSLVLLVCSCPCALVVSIPLSYFAAIGNASGRGILFKGSRYLDAMRGVDTVYLDKTGTLTTGRFSVTEVEPAEGYSADTVLEYAAALDSQSTHPLAVAIVAAASRVPEATDVQTVDHGMLGKVSGHDILVGSPLLMQAKGVKMPALGRGSSLVCVAVDGHYAGYVSLDDTLRPDAVRVVSELHDLGVKRVVILSGDRPQAVERVARMVGADGFEAGLLPHTKYDVVTKARRQGHKVAFVGDGINDAPSLAAADVGIAIGTGGTDVAMESADAVITGNTLGHIAYAIRLSRKIKRVVTENVSVAIGVKLAVMVLGAMGLASLWAAVFADTGITLLTVAWTLVSLRVRDSRPSGRARSHA